MTANAPQSTPPNNDTTNAILRVLGGFSLLLGFIFLFAWLLNGADARDFAAGQRVEGTVVQIWEGDSPGASIEFVDRNGRSQTIPLEKVSSAQLAALEVGDPVVAVQMKDSPSRVLLLEDAEAQSSSLGGLIIATLFLLTGLFLVMQKRPSGSKARQELREKQQTHLASGTIFFFCGILMLIGFLATAFDNEMHLVLRILFGGLCLLAGSVMAFSGVKQFRQARQMGKLLRQSRSDEA